MPKPFRKNPAFERQLAASAEYQRGLAAAAKPAAKQAQLLSHNIMPEDRDTDIAVAVEGGRVFIVNRAHGGHIDEWGSANSPPYAPLRRGIRAAPGLRLKEQ